MFSNKAERGLGHYLCIEPYNQENVTVENIDCSWTITDETDLEKIFICPSTCWSEGFASRFNASTVPICDAAIQSGLINPTVGGAVMITDVLFSESTYALKKSDQFCIKPGLVV